jgi:CO/xanthine dehydrogenase FAD-binding subunit
MRMLKGTDFGTDKNSLLLLYKSLIRSKIDYGAQIYSCAKKTHLNKLDIVQNTALRLAMGALYPTPARDLEVEAGIVPL